jgi:hypothetical protein
MICVEVATDDDAFNRRDSRSNYVTDVRQELSDSDLTFSNVLCGLGFFVTASDQVAL